MQDVANGLSLWERNTQLKQIELFAGIGGFGLAGHWAGIETVCQVEIDPFCQKVLAKNFPHAHRHADIKTFDGTQWRGVDIVSGGFPCQPYSTAGKRKGNDDDRALWPEMLRVIREVAPEWVVGENVAGLISMDGGRVFDGVVSDLEDAGYTVETFIIPACGVGAPHKRDRIWIVAHATLSNDRGNAGAVSGKDGRQKQYNLPEFGSTNQLFGETATHPEIPKCQCSCLARARRDGLADYNLTATNSQCRNKQNGGYGQESKGQRQADEHRNGINGHGWTEPWLQVATRICRVDDGIPRRVDRSKRLKALGNAIVPQVAYQIFKAICQTRSAP